MTFHELDSVEQLHGRMELWTLSFALLAAFAFYTKGNLVNIFQSCCYKIYSKCLKKLITFTTAVTLVILTMKRFSNCYKTE